MKRMILAAYILLLSGCLMLQQASAQENTCTYERAFKNEYLPLNAKMVSQTGYVLGLLNQLDELNKKSAAAGGATTADGLSKEDSIHYTELSTQLKAAMVETALSSRRLQNLQDIDKFVHIAQKEYAGTAPNLSKKEISYYADQMNSDAPFLTGYDDEKAHELFLEYFAKEIDNKTVGLSDAPNSGGCDLDAGLASLIVEMGSRMPADNGEAIKRKMKSLLDKYGATDKQGIDNIPDVSDKNEWATLIKEQNAFESEYAFIVRVEGIRSVNRISSAMYQISNEDLLKSGGSGDFVANHDFSKDFPEKDQGLLDLVVRLNNKFPSKLMAGFSPSANNQPKAAN